MFLRYHQPWYTHWRARALLATLLVTLLPALPASTAFYSGACYKLHKAYAENGAEHEVTVLGRTRGVAVLAGACSAATAPSPPRRAAAALLLAALRHGLRLRSVRLLCDGGDDALQGDELALAPTMNWNEITVDGYASGPGAGAKARAGARDLQVVGAGAAPLNLASSDNVTRTVRVADASIMRQFAPSVLEVFGRFSPTIIDLQKVIEWDKAHANTSIEEAACVWALNHTETFKSWLELEWKRYYEVAVFMCVDDPDKKEYVKVLNEIWKLQNESATFFLDIRPLYVNCSNDYSLMNIFIERMQSVYWPRLIGGVSVGAARGAGARAVASAAAAMHTALVYCEPPAGESPCHVTPGHVTPGSMMPGSVPPGSVPPGCMPPGSARAATGGLSQLARALHAFLAACRWSRLAIISEDTDTGTELVAAMRVYNITLRNVSINIADATATATATRTALRALLKDDSRIIFVNGNPDIAMFVLCAARDLGKLSDASYAWILRDWRSEDLKCGNISIRAEKYNHYSVSFQWRGGNSDSFNFTSNRSMTRERLERLWGGGAWPPQAAPLADALEMLLHGFRSLLLSQPELQHDLHSENTLRAFWASHDKNPPFGVMQTLSLEQCAIKNPLVFIYKWRGKLHHLEAVWQVHGDNVSELYQPRPFFEGRPPGDGLRVCRTTAAGDPFAPRCHDGAWLAAAAAAAIALPAALLARRARRGWLARRDRLLTGRLLAHGRRAAASLAAHLMDRAVLQLGRELGAGRFGRVYHARVRTPGKPPLIVAAKALREEAAPAEEREFLDEAVTLATLRHDHVVRLVGVCVTGGPPLVLMEYAFYGDLLGYLFARRHLVGQTGDKARCVSAPELTRLARQAAGALAYLRRQRLVHRDVRAANCLLDERRALKLADFGLARVMGSGEAGDEYFCRRRGLFPVLWMAPESLERGVFTPASDAWALGVLLLELATLGARPYGCWPKARVRRYVLAGGSPPLPADISPDLRRVLGGCWERAAEARATANDVAAELARCPHALRPALVPADPQTDMTMTMSY